MAELSTIARPYAEAAFSAAIEGGNLTPWSEALDALAAFAASDAMSEVVSDPRVTTDQKVSLFASLVPGVDAGLRNLLVTLAEHGRFGVLPELAAQFRALKIEHEGSADAQVVSAFPLGDAMLATLAATLEKRFGRKIVPHVSVDPSLIGGVTIRVGDEVIDASVRGRLAAMDAALRN